MPRTIAKSSKGALIGDGLSKKVMELITQIAVTQSVNRPGNHDQVYQELAALLESTIEVHDLLAYLQTGRVDELLDVLEKQGLIASKEAYRSLPNGNGHK